MQRAVLSWRKVLCNASVWGRRVRTYGAGGGDRDTVSLETAPATRWLSTAHRVARYASSVPHTA
eukprot:139063-Rhodomonas_salina.1